jgi:acylphosphatase
VENSSDKSEMHAIIKGRVQGVGFRATTRYYALELGLTGTVRNLTDGSVEIYAQGSKQDLESLLQKLQSEAGPGDIESVDVEYSSIQKPYFQFHIIR